VILAVNGYDETKEIVEKFVEAKQLEQRMLLQGGAVAREKYLVDAYPTTFFVDRDGKITKRDVGFAPGLASAKEKEIRDFVAKNRAKTEAEPESGKEAGDEGTKAEEGGTPR
jgi:hypothetical protein